MSSSSSSFTPTYDVFLSCAEDSRQGLVSHLNRYLTERGNTTYFRDDKMDKSVSSLDSESFINPWDITIDSKVAVVVVSESYRASDLCLNELQTILYFLSIGQLLVLPIFDGVDLSIVKNQTEELVEPFTKLSEAYSEKVQAWRSALIELTNLFPLDLHYISGEENKVEQMARKVEVLLSHSDKLINVSELFGLDRQMKVLNLLLDSKCNEDVCLIGICGPGGIGKTTLARFAYGNLSNKFRTHMFVGKAENIYQNDPGESRSLEAFTSGSQEGAQKKKREQNLSTGEIKSTVIHRKTLLVIDCVDNTKQLKNIAEIISWCGSGSRVILITHDKKLLDELGVEHVYEVEPLRYDEALQLFSLSAFKEKNPPTSFESLSLRAIQITSFLPLSLKLLGSSLQGKNEDEWEKKLEEFEGDHERAIMGIKKKIYARENEENQIPSFIFP